MKLDGALRSLLLLAWLATLSPAQETATDAALSYDALRQVLRSRPGDERSAHQVVAELERLGTGMIPVYLEVLAGSGIERVLDEARPFEERSWVCLPEECAGLVEGALVRLPHEAVLEQLERFLAPGFELPGRLGALRVLQALGSADGLDLCLRIGGELGANVRSPLVRDALRGACTAILRHDDRAWDRIARLPAASSRELGLVLIEALGEAAHPAGTRVLAQWLDRTPEPAERRALATELARLESLFPWQLAGSTAALRTALARSRDLEDRCLAAELAALVHDPARVPELIELLSETDARLRRTAAAALCALFRMDLGQDAAAWSEWFEHERSWWETRGEFLLDELQEEKSGRVYAALRELAQHPLYSRESAGEIASVLPDLPVSCARSACRVLAELASRAAIPGLLLALEEGAPENHDAVRQALRSLTGEDPSEALPVATRPPGLQLRDLSAERLTRK